MLKPLQDFINTKTPSKHQALSILRGLFASMFLAQLAIAFLLAFTLYLVSERQNSSPLVSQILVLFTLLQLPLGISLPMLAAKQGGKGPALTAVIFMAVLLSTPGWFAAFAFLTGSQSSYLLFMLLLVMLSYTTGFFLCNRYANLALIDPNEPKQNEPKPNP